MEQQIITLASVFTDGAVLQRQMEIPVWGSATPGAWIRGDLAGRTTYCKASSEGRFRLIFQPLEAGGPHVLVVSDMETGDSCSIEDVYIGEVWLASGQSNMEYALNSHWFVGANETEDDLSLTCVRQEKEFKDTMAGGCYANFHFISLPLRATMAQEDSGNASWQRMTENCSEASAVAAWFGLALHDKLDIPVGLIISDWGGTIVEGWTSRGALLSNPDTCGMMHDYVKRMAMKDTWTDTREARARRLFTSYAVKDSGNTGFEKGWASPEHPTDDWQEMKVPGSWIKQKIAGNGAVWFRRDVDLGEEWAGQELTLNLGGIDKQDVTYFNGVEVGGTGTDLEDQYWNQPRHYRIPAKLVRAGRNVIAIRGYSFASDGSLNGKDICYSLCNEAGSLSLPLVGTWKAKVERDMGGVTIPNTNDSYYGPDYPNTPSILFDSMIRPLLPYAIRGAIWYQGESNAMFMDNAKTYAGKVSTMIRDWRTHWEEPDFPFIQVELANYCERQTLSQESIWAVLREQQQKATRMEKNVYLTTAVDVGDADDIHPQDKKTVGRRLAAVAFREVYGDSKVICYGPRLVSWTRAQGNNAVQLTFAEAAGMTLIGDPSQAFCLAGEDRRFYPAELFDIQGNTLVMATSKVADPVAIRYGWSDNPASILYNGAGLPASPFRTDDWEADTISLGE